MAKISIFNVLNQRKKFRIFTGLATLLVLTFLAQFLLIQNPFGAKAFDPDANGLCVVDNNNLDIGDNTGTTCEGRDILVPTNKTLRMSGSHQFRDFTVDGGTLVLTGGPHEFRNLTVTNNGKIEHEALISGTDFVVGTNVLTASGEDKKVDIKIQPGGKLTLSYGGKIDVTGKGYPGGTSGSSGHGQGAGFGIGTSTGADGGGGGAYGGIGGRPHNSGGSWGNVSVVYPADYSNAFLPTLHGSGGGAAIEYAGDDEYANGGAGGGVIKIDADFADIEVTRTASIVAAGQQGPNDRQWAAGGGGSGGSIWIKANNLFTTVKSDSSVNVSGGDGYEDGAPGTVIYTGSSVRTYGHNIIAAGGVGLHHAGAGGGGRIKLDITKVSSTCILDTGDSYIPSSCENRDVSISNTQIYANSTKVWQENGTHLECPASHYANVDADPDMERLQFVHQPGDVPPPNTFKCEYAVFGASFWIYYLDPVEVNHLLGEDCENLPSGGNIAFANEAYPTNDGWGDGAHPQTSAKYPTCDSKRNFKSLTLNNYAILTHSGITVDNMLQDIDNDSSLADELTGTARWKKIEFVVEGDVKISNNSKINVDGKGYPGGYIAWSDGNSRKIGEESEQDNGGAPNPANHDTYWPTNGFGPGRGLLADCNGANQNCRAGGGGYGGNGGKSTSAAETNYSNSYNSDYKSFEFGSGGGASTVIACVTFPRPYCPVWSWARGGSGGGRVKIDTNGNFTIDASSNITAKGFNGVHMNGSSGTRSMSGAGSGGTIFINYKKDFITSPGTLVSAAGGYYLGVSTSPVVKLAFHSGGEIYNLAANAGLGGSNDGITGYGGGGGRIFLRHVVDATPTVSKTLWPVSRSGNTPPEKFNPYALQYDDIVRVELDVTSILQPTTVKDTWLETVGSNAAVCEPILNDPVKYPFTELTDQDQRLLIWQVETNSEIFYHCKVKKP